jgi:hypothetical protein
MYGLRKGLGQEDLNAIYPGTNQTYAQVEARNWVMDVAAGAGNSAFIPTQSQIDYVASEILAGKDPTPPPGVGATSCPSGYVLAPSGVCAWVESAQEIAQGAAQQTGEFNAWLAANPNAAGAPAYEAAAAAAATPVVSNAPPSSSPATVISSSAPPSSTPSTVIQSSAPPASSTAAASGGTATSGFSLSSISTWGWLAAGAAVAFFAFKK